MWRGLYAAASGMITETKRTDTIANNLANADTTGFKKDVAVSKEFEPMFIRRINDYDPKTKVTSFKGFSLNGKPPRVGTLGVGASIAEIATDREQGALKTTGNPLDVAIAGDGFFAVQTDQGVRYTRDGAFVRSSTGQLQNMKGQPVLNAQGRPITIPGNVTHITIGAQGEIAVGNPQNDMTYQRVDQLMFVSFGPDRRAILKQGDNLWNPREGAVPEPATGEIQQGCLEASNANVVMDMVELINNQRIYEAGAKSVMTQDTMLEKAVTEVGRVT
ncbi:MAG: flagellar basal-body rod protein FlgF [Selenomonadaceae bacterium]|nr:flagellar basal-body rod protein FlgF [Selenomonadaceae bacterium]